MKFYQVIAPMIFCVMHTVMIFGMEEVEEVTVVVCHSILNLIDQFRSDKDHYEEAGHVLKKDKNIDIKKISRAQDLIEYRYGEYKYRTCEHDTATIPISRAIFTTHTVFLSLSDMKEKEYSEELKKKICFKFENGPGNLTSEKVHKDPKIMLVLRDRKYVYDLEAPERINAYEISEDGEIIVTCSVEGNIRKWEFQKKFKEGYKMEEVYPGGRIRGSNVIQKNVEKNDVYTDE